MTMQELFTDLVEEHRLRLLIVQIKRDDDDQEGRCQYGS